VKGYLNVLSENRSLVRHKNELKKTIRHATASTGSIDLKENTKMKMKPQQQGDQNG
jgi:hypothetical protein